MGNQTAKAERSTGTKFKPGRNHFAGRYQRPVKEAIKEDKGPLRAIAARHHVSFNSAQKIRAGKL
jgi:hypothetical protein